MPRSNCHRPSRATFAGFVLAGAMLLFWGGPAAADPPASDAPRTIYVEVQGSLEGIKSADLPRVFAAQMAQAPTPAWHFEPADTAAPHAANRVEWLLKPGSDAAGGVRTFGFSRGMMARLLGSHRVVAVEARVFLNNTYEGMVSGQIRDSGDPQDPEFGSKVSDLTRQLLSPAVIGTVQKRSDLGRGQTPS
jgi:hypothetical protein